MVTSELVVRMSAEHLSLFYNTNTLHLLKLIKVSILGSCLLTRRERTCCTFYASLYASLLLQLYLWCKMLLCIFLIPLNINSCFTAMLKLIKKKVGICFSWDSICQDLI